MKRRVVKIGKEEERRKERKRGKRSEKKEKKVERERKRERKIKRTGSTFFLEGEHSSGRMRILDGRRE